jgi:hypothetical protein
MTSRSDAIETLQDIIDWLKRTPKIKGWKPLMTHLENQRLFINRYKVDGERVLTLLVRQAYDMARDYLEYAENYMGKDNDKSVML